MHRHYVTASSSRKCERPYTENSELVARLTRMLDLTDQHLRRALGLTLKELAVEDWRKLQDAGKESFTQAFGRAVAEVGGSGLLARSAAVRGGVNLVIFPGVCRAD